MQSLERIIVENVGTQWTARLCEIPIVSIFGASAPEALAKLLDVLNVDPDQCIAIDEAIQDNRLVYSIPRREPRWVEIPNPSKN